MRVWESRSYPTMICVYRHDTIVFDDKVPDTGIACPIKLHFAKKVLTFLVFKKLNQSNPHSHYSVCIS